MASTLPSWPYDMTGFFTESSPSPVAEAKAQERKDREALNPILIKKALTRGQMCGEALGGVTTLAVAPRSDASLSSSSIDHSVKFYPFPDGVFQSNLVQCTLSIRSLTFNKGTVLATARENNGAERDEDEDYVSGGDNDLLEIIFLSGFSTQGQASF
ncbi:hypothetical protein GUJ93_ZPchr0010g9867 [Zizania palustris]|uniref:Uncharacterized protein n=1 Tax=Zizania palustris TaxID=103762 RepID=A0A8J5WD72_ZIZPA|nr:hypothetical protein GUJ93_ZPchr0010g9867 [Zizania palustris]